MSVPTFVDLQGFIVGGEFIVKEFASLKDGFELTHYMFTPTYPWEYLTKAERRQVAWLKVNHHGISWEDGLIPHSMARDLITKAVMGTTATNDEIVVYVKGCEKREWLQDLLLDEAKEEANVENIEVHYEDIKPLNKLDITYTLRCRNHVNNCALCMRRMYLNCIIGDLIIKNKNVGIIKVIINGEEMTSNASIVFWNETPLIITSAHSVFEWYQKKFAESISFFDNFGNEISVKSIIFSNKWINEGILDFDTAILVPDGLNPNNYRNIHPLFGVNKFEKVSIVSLKKGRFKDKVVSYDANSFSDYIYESSMVAVKMKSKKGDSGSPWYYQSKSELYQITNTSLSFKKQKKITFAPHWGEQIKGMFIFSVNVSDTNENYIRHFLY